MLNGKVKKEQRYTYGYNYNESLYSIAPTNYRKTYRNNEWRYLGYNMDGNPIENPYFQPDALFPDQHNLGTSRLVWGNIHNLKVQVVQYHMLLNMLIKMGFKRKKSCYYNWLWWGILGRIN